MRIMIYLLKKISSPHPLESEVFQNSFLPPPLVSNVGLIDMITDHRTIITDFKEDDYLFYYNRMEIK